MRLTHSYSELLERVQNFTRTKKAPGKTADEIAADIIKRHGLIFDQRKEQEK